MQNSRRLKGSSQNKINNKDIIEAKKNTNNRYFKDRLSIGDQGELIVKEFLIRKGYNYIDCTRHSKTLSLQEIKAWEAVEVDLIIESKLDYKEKKVEIKTSTKEIEKNSHLCIKVSSWYADEKQRMLKGDDAYLYRTEADNIFFVCLQSKNIYSIRTEDLIAYIEKNVNNKEKVYWKTYFDENNIKELNRYNKCAYVNVQDLFENKLLKKLTKIEN